MTTPKASTALIDWTVLGKVVEFSLLLGLGLVLVVSLAVIASSKAMRSGTSAAVRGLSWLATAVLLGGLVAAMWWGLVIITTKA